MGDRARSSGFVAAAGRLGETPAVGVPVEIY